MKAIKFITHSLLVVTLISCAKVPVTGRRQVKLLPSSTLMSMSLTNYQSFLNSNKVVPLTNDNAQMVRRVGIKIQEAVIKYMTDEHMYKQIADYKWEFNLVDDNTVNAWCMPGGKVVVYTGLLPVSQTEAGLAVVMGHEIAHAIARHGNERMSQQLAVSLGGLGLGVALANKPDITRNAFMASYGAASTLGTLKYSRLHESEADKMGLIFMAMAGYNPSEATSFWTRMSKTGGSSVPEFMSTHPNHDTRIADIEALLPEAMNYYKASKKQ